ncbi:YvrJ family protein [Paenibacillus chartarius]|uniref:YvrJ family protein n=1 Tax=Paenibacillus chartarius TaxID=747481 RepID=A0ABV6DFG8_9BACL
MDDTQTLSLVTNSISNLGFPIVITVYLLTRFEKKLDTLNTSIVDLLTALKDEVRKKDG